MAENGARRLLTFLGGVAVAALAARGAQRALPGERDSSTGLSPADDPSAAEFEPWRIPAQRIAPPPVPAADALPLPVPQPAERLPEPVAAPLSAGLVESPQPTPAPEPEIPDAIVVEAEPLPDLPRRVVHPPPPGDDEDDEDDRPPEDYDDEAPSFLALGSHIRVPAVGVRREERQTPRWAVAAALGVIALVALILRWIGAQESLFGDELFTYRIATGDSFSAFLDRFEETPNSVPPVFFVLAWLAGKLGDPTILIRLPSVLAGVAAVPLLYLLAKRMGGRQAGLIAAALLAVQPFAIFYGTEARSYGLLLLLLPLMTLALLRALEGGGARWWVVYGLTAAVAIYTHYVAGLAVAVHVLWALVVARRQWRAIIGVNAAVLVSFLPWVPHLNDDALLAKAIGVLHPLTVANVVSGPLRVAFGHPFADAAAVPGVLSLVLLGLALVSLAAFVLLRRRRPSGTRREWWLLAGLVIGLPFLTWAYSAARDSIYLPRNMITILPYVCVAFALLLGALPRRAAAVVAAVVLLAATVATTRSLADHARPDLRAAADLIESRSPPGTRVIEPLVFKGAELSQDLAIHLDDRYPVSHDLRSVRGRGSREVWLVAPVADLRPRIAFAAKAARAQLVEQHTFTGLFDVYAARYRLPGAGGAPGAAAPRLVARDLAAKAGIARSGPTQGENCVFDFNRDGVSDLFLSTGNRGPWQLFAGSRSGRFRRSNATTFPAGDRRGCTTADFNGDRRPDIYASMGASPEELWIQTPSGRFVDRSEPFRIHDLGGRGRPPMAIDADGDRWPDLLTAHGGDGDSPSRSRLWLNEDGRRFAYHQGLPSQEIQRGCATAGDVDGDRYDELFVCGGDDGEYFFRAYDTAGGRWSVANQKLGLPDYGRADAELADMNSDDRLDLVIVGPRALEVRLNRDGRFPKADYTLALQAGRDLAVADANGDGRSDLYVLQGANGKAEDLLLLSDRTGTKYLKFPRIPQAQGGEGDTVTAVPDYAGSRRAAFVVNNGSGGKAGPRMLVQLTPAG